MIILFGLARFASSCVASLIVAEFRRFPWQHDPLYLMVKWNDNQGYATSGPAGSAGWLDIGYMYIFPKQQLR